MLYKKFSKEFKEHLRYGDVFLCVHTKLFYERAAKNFKLFFIKFLLAHVRFVHIVHHKK